MNRLYLRGVLAAWLVLGGGAALADNFGSGVNSFSIDFVTIGNPGNPPDLTGNPTPAGAVSYTYRIGKFEVSEQMIDKANADGGLGIVKETRGPDKPAMLRWFDAAKFVNWLNTSTGSVPAYKFVSGGSFQLWQPTDPGYDANNRFRNKLATYFLPSVDEWYKAAYYDQTTGTYFDYPTGQQQPANCGFRRSGPRNSRLQPQFHNRPCRHYARRRTKHIWHHGTRWECRRMGRDGVRSDKQRSYRRSRCTWWSLVQ